MSFGEHDDATAHIRPLLVGSVMGAATGALLWAIGVRPRGRDGDRIAHIAALVAVHLVLRASGDPHTRSTVRTLSWVVPVGAALALGAGVGTAYLHGFSTTPSTWVLTVTSVLLVLAATFAAGRAIALPPDAARRRSRAGARRAA